MATHHQCVPNAESEKVLQEGCADSSPSTVLIPEESDYVPSISLAATLLLIFISALPILSQPGTIFVSFGNLNNISRKEAHFHPLLYIQPRTTQLTIETLAKNQEETITVLAVAQEYATQTLVCFSKNVIALLIKQDQGHPIIRQVIEVKTLEKMRNINNTKASELFSVSVMTRRAGLIPHCTILRPTSLVTGNVHLIEIIPAQEKAETMWRDSSIIAHELLELVYKIGQVPGTFEVKGSPRGHVKVIHVLDDPYLEGGIVC